MTKIDYTKGGELPSNKTCTSCVRHMPRDDEHFRPYNGRTIDGLRPICRECERSYDRDRKRALREAKKAG